MLIFLDIINLTNLADLTDLTSEFRETSNITHYDLPDLTGSGTSVYLHDRTPICSHELFSL